MDRNNLIVVILAFLMIVIMLVPGMGNVPKLIIMGIALLLILLTRRGSIYFAAANRKYVSKDPAKLPKALEQYRRALRAGVPAKYAVTISSLLIQNGDAEAGAKALEKLIAKGGKDKTVTADAKTALSMAAWIGGDLERAISLCEEVHASGARSSNLYINLSTYYLEAGRISDFDALVKEFRKDGKLSSAALTDLVAVDEFLVRGNWKAAGSILSTMHAKRTYTFADPYVHMAQVKMHYGARKEALSYIRKGLENCVFSGTAIISAETLEKIAALLEDEKDALRLMSANEKDPLALVNGDIPQLSDDIITFEAEPEAYGEAEEYEASPASDQREDGDISTELTDDDEEWMRKHGL